MKTLLSIALILLTIASLQAQEKTKKERNWTMQGYVKDMRTLLIDDLDNMLVDNLLHHRLNFKWYPHDNWTVALEWRNRLFYGELVKSIPMYAELIDDANNDVLDLSWVVLDRQAMVLHTMIDRGYVDFVKGNFEARLGRQRINWGINTVWNPHDLFNTASFLDFDYEERPGSDALRLQYYTGVASSVEVAFKAFEKKEEIVAAGLWRVNKGNYDLQFLGGAYYDDIALGLGWAGNLKDVGFKGEFSTFIPFRNASTQEVAYVGTISLDYTIKDWYLMGSALYNSTGDNSANISNLFNFQLTPKSLSPYKTSLFTSASYQISPLIGANMGVIYSPGQTNALFLNPSLSISLKDNWTLDAFGQLFFSKVNDKYTDGSKLVFVRMKWSY